MPIVALSLLVTLPVALLVFCVQVDETALHPLLLDKQIHHACQ